MTAGCRLAVLFPALWLFFVLLASPYAKAQVVYQLSGESGIKSSYKATDNRYAAQVNVDGLAKAGVTFGGMKTGIVLRVRPELNDFNRKLTALRYRVAADIEQQWDGITLGLQMYSHKNALYGSDYTIKNDVFFFRAPVVFIANESLSWKITPGYAAQTAKVDLFKETETIYADAVMSYAMDMELTCNLGLYGERFVVRADNPYPYYGYKNENAGYRYGVHTGLEYNGSVMLGVDYRFLLQNSEVTKPVCVENNLHLFAGTMPTENISLLLLYDMSVTNFRLKNGAMNETLMYIPFEKEDRLHVKIGYDMTEKTEIYISYGYKKENITFDRTIFDGTSCMLGVTYSSE